MVKINIMYPKRKGVKFNFDYYMKTHLPLLKQRFGKSLKGIEVYHGSTKKEGYGSPFIAIVSLTMESIEDFQEVFKQHSRELITDNKNFANSNPILQINKQVPA